MFVLLFVHVKNACFSGDSRLGPYGRKGLQKFKGRNFSSSCMFFWFRFFFFLGWGIDNHENGGVSGMRIGRGNQSTRRKLVPVPLCPPQIPHGLCCMN
jgi:hypothetical protein